MNPECKKILLVEDNPADVRLLTELLSKAVNSEFCFEVVDRIATALKFLDEEQFEVILLDLSLPDGSGLDTVRYMCNASPNIPIVVLTGLEDDSLALEAVQMGAQDYLVKGQIDGQRLLRIIRYAIERKHVEKGLQYLATHDALTELPNRFLFHDRLLQAIERSRRKFKEAGKKWQIAIVILDLDNFKDVNDRLGHAAGDQLLQMVAHRMRSRIRSVDTVARLGGDEFTLIFENISGKRDLKTVGEKTRAIFSAPFPIAEEQLSVTASIGISLYPQDGREPEILLKHADMAMYAAKQARNGYFFYDRMMDK
jgi:diguanylate cyclase (GGDEF)-like protein